MIWLIAVPYGDSKDKTYRKIEGSLKSIDKKLVVNRFQILNLKHGTLDNCSNLSDDLAKQDVSIEQQVNKILSILTDVSGKKRKEFIPEVIEPKENRAIVASEYIKKHFKWDEKQFVLTNSLDLILKKMVKKTVKYEMDIRVQHHTYVNQKQLISSLERKSGGNLMVRGLDGIIKQKDIVESEYLTTLFVVVANDRKKEFLNSYEEIVEFVVPESATLIQEDKDYCLFSVVIIRKMVQDFKNECMKRKFIIRPYVFDPKKQELMSREKDDVKAQLKGMKKKLVEVAKIGFSESFMAWLHIKAMRVFVESVLRYGLPARFVCAMIQLETKHVKKVHKYFRNEFKFLIDENMEEVEESVQKSRSVPFYQSHGFEFHPYVLITINKSPSK